MTYTVQAMIERLNGDRIRNVTLAQAHQLAEAVLRNNPDRDVRVTIKGNGRTIFVREQKVSTASTCRAR